MAKGLAEENWMPPYRPPALLDILAEFGGSSRWEFGENRTQATQAPIPGLLTFPR